MQGFLEGRCAWNHVMGNHVMENHIRRGTAVSRACKYAGAHSLISDKTNFLYIQKICPMILLHLLTWVA